MPMEKQRVEIGDYEDESTIMLPEKLLQAARSKPAARHMQKVPSLLRQANNPKDYDPLVVSLGPYHHGKEELQLVEDFKLRTLETFVADSSKDVLFFYTKVHEQINEVRSCYIKEFTEAYDDKTFAQMILLDACFTINFLLMYFDEKFVTTLKELGVLVFSMAKRDAFLLENQIPFPILKLLMGLRFGNKEGKEMLRKCVNILILGRDMHRSIPKTDSGEQPLHLLEAFWLVLNFKSNEVQPSSFCPNSCSITCNHALEFLYKHITDLGTVFMRRRQSQDDAFIGLEYIHSFRSVSDLKAKGIHFRPSNGLSFKFKSGYFRAHLDVPRDVPSKLSKVVYLNIVAFEMCAETTKYPVCDHLEFMKSLLDSPKDVKELREKKILLSCLDSDEEVVKLYKDIKIPFDRISDMFSNVKDEIEAHYNNKAKTWLAEFLYTYCQSPWKALALFSAIFLLVLTVLLTFFAIKPRSTK